MWHTPNQRLRAIANAKKREREKARRPFHVKRINASLQIASIASSQTAPSEDKEVESDKTDVRVILNDLSVKGVGLFSPTFFNPGQEIVLGIVDPMKLDIRGRVIWCQEHDANSHILSKEPYSYRLAIEFILPTLEEQQGIKAFWEEVCKNYLYAARAA